ncbi:MAG TPA: lyase family protein [Candidatus Methylomirabilis sp.]|nr:lyase family protein [Candidatus Methylomirabilis sp.]
MAEQDSSGFNLLDWLYQDDACAALLDFDATFSAWVAVELALAESQFEMGLLDEKVIKEIRHLRGFHPDDLEKFRAAARNVGFPIFGLVQMLNDALPTGARGQLHLGATTQDIMDTAVALQVHAVGQLLQERLISYGDRLAELTSRHAATPMAGRTHAQHAVPTTFGLKCAVYLGEATRSLERLRFATNQAAQVSLFGAAGTSAAMGADARELRAKVAARLGLAAVDLPWHVSRDRFAGLAFCCSLLSASLARLAREVIDLSRTEIGEVNEAGGWHRGASSTMPQKRNSITSEALLGMALAAECAAAAMARAMETGHERAAGEWHLEWKALPETLRSTSSALALAGALLEGLVVNTSAMARNLMLDHGLVMAEAYMLGLARIMGREAAHDLVYRASQAAREQDIPLPDALTLISPSVSSSFPAWPLEATGYLGDAERVSHEAVAAWTDARQPSTDR